MINTSNLEGTINANYSAVLIPEAIKPTTNAQSTHSPVPSAALSLLQRTNSFQSAFQPIKTKRSARLISTPYAPPKNTNETPSNGQNIQAQSSSSSQNISDEIRKKNILKIATHILKVEECLRDRTHKLVHNGINYDRFTIKNCALKTRVFNLGGNKKKPTGTKLDQIYTPDVPLANELSGQTELQKIQIQLERWFKLKTAQNANNSSKKIRDPIKVFGKKPYLDGTIRIKINDKIRGFQTARAQICDDCVILHAGEKKEKKKTEEDS